MFLKKLRCIITIALSGSFMISPLYGATIGVPARPVAPPATVAIIKDNTINYNTMVSQALESALGIGGISNLVHPGTTVLIKPNLVSNKALAVTDWHVVRALVDLIKVANAGASITIAEGSASNATTTTKTIMAAQGYTTTNFPDVTLLDLNNLTECPTNTFVLADGLTGTDKQVAQIITNADVYIDMPKMKTHYHAGYTGAVKNLGIGIAPWPLWNNAGINTNKGGLHHDIRREIVDHILCRVPDLTVMDAIQAMEGQGPASGTAVTMNLVLASKDPVALDAVACNIMGIPPYLINHLVLAANENVGVIDMNNIMVTGNTTIAAVQRNFTRATPGTATLPLEPGVIPYRATTVIRPALQNMVIDGNLCEWGYANVLKAEDAYQVKGTGTGWGGPTDCSFNSKFLYDANNLYIALTIRDDVKLPNTNSGSNITNGECVELYLSTYGEQYDVNHGTTYLPQHDYRLGISYATTPQAWILSHNQALAGIVISKVETSDGYIIEASIPWSNFVNFTMNRYRDLGINVAVDDADISPSTVDDKIMLANAKDSDIETNPFKMGMAYLDPQGGIYDVPSYTLAIVSTNGTITKNPDQPTYAANAIVSLTATPNSGYSFSGWSGDATGTTSPLNVTMYKNKNITAHFTNQVLTSIVISPSNSSVNIASTQQVTASALDQNNNPLTTQPEITWNVSGGGIIDASGLFTAGVSAGGPYTITATSGTVSAIASITVTQVNTAPTIATAASANPGTATATTAALSVLGADDNGEAALTYTWATTGTPPATVSFTANGTNAAKATTVTFSKAGTYAFQVSVKDAGNLTATSTVTVTVNQTLTTIIVSPTSASIVTSATQQYSATARDQFATSLTTQPTFTWSANGGGNISTSGLFTAGLSAGGPYTITASNGTASGTASVTVTAASVTVYQINCGSTSAATPFKADQYYSGGTARTVTNTISTTGVTNPAPQAVYKAERYGATTYTLPSLTASAQYTVRLHFAELYQTASGKRVFNVLINGTTVLSNFDIYVAAGGNYKAVVREFTATANSSGQIVIKFNTVTDNATIGGIEIISSTPNAAPIIETAASAAPGTVTGTTAALSVLGADDNGEAALTYTWATTGTPPAAVSFSANGTNAAKASTATFSKAGTYAFQVTVKDAGNLTAISNVTVTVNQTLTSIVLSPANASIVTSATQQYTATARDQFATNLTTQPTFTWSVSDGGIINASGLFTAGISAGGPYTITATSGTVSAIASITVTQVNTAPTIATAASANPGTATATTAALSVLGADDNGEAALTYTWATTGTPPAAVSFTANGTNAAKATTVTFSKAGTYAFQVSVKDAGNLTATSTVTVTVNQTLTTIIVSPTSASIVTSATQQYSATARDQFATSLTTQPTFTWSANGGGNISTSGLFTAGLSAGGPYTITATSGTVSAIASITVIQVNTAPTIATAASANPGTVTATTAALSVLGADDNGETALTYTWATTGTPPAAVSFTANGTNAAKATIVTFSKAGTYAFQVSVKDAGNLTATSTVTVTVNQTLTTIIVSPTSASIVTSATQQYSATARDQFATGLTTQPTFTWSANGGGNIGTSGLFTAGLSAGGPYTITASNGTVSGTASVTVTAASVIVYQINCGSTSAASPFKADQYYSGGTARTVTNTISTTGVTNPAPQAVYKAERYGATTYTFPSLTASAQYTVRLHFAELYQTASGKRVFNVLINGTTVLSNFDIYVAAGGNYKAVVREFTATANSSGQVVIKFNTVTDNATIQGIEIIKK